MVPENSAVSIVAPASYANPDRVDLGLKALRTFGLSPKPAEHAHRRGPLYFAGTEQNRLEDLHAAFANPATNMVMSLRGGYGSNYLLAGLDLELIRQQLAVPGGLVVELVAGGRKGGGAVGRAAADGARRGADGLGVVVAIARR